MLAVSDRRTPIIRIEITGEAERIVQAAIATGKFASAEEFVVALVTRFERDDCRQLVGPLAEHIDIDTLAADQGVGPIQDFRQLQAAFWPEGESVEDFLGAIRTVREQDVPRER